MAHVMMTFPFLDTLSLLCVPPHQVPGGIKRAETTRLESPSRSLPRGWWRHGSVVPIQDLRPVPMHDALEAIDVVVDRLQVFDAVGLAADIGVDGQRQNFRALPAFVVKTIELIDGA